MKVKIEELKKLLLALPLSGLLKYIKDQAFSLQFLTYKGTRPQKSKE